MQKPVLRLQANTKGRDFVVGDIHGCFDILDRALASVSFDPTKDRLICVGDLVDRGPYSARALDYIRKPWFYSVRGNHEDMFLLCLRNDFVDKAMVNQFLPHGFGWILETPLPLLRQIKEAFLKLPTAIEIDSPEGPIGFVHADIPKQMSWQQFLTALERGSATAASCAAWSRGRVLKGDASGVEGAHRVFFGHTVVKGARQLGNCFFIDTGGVFRYMNCDNLTDKIKDYFLCVAETTAPAADILKRPAPDTDFMVAIKTPVAPKPPAPKPPRP